MNKSLGHNAPPWIMRRGRGDHRPLWAPQVEELYELYCLQWRLCQGVVNMKKAFARSPPTRACRESLLELSRSHRHSLQDISEMERELEILLGELHIKMKGLIGFARLCPGDQYEVTVQLGRQRWRIRGRIKSDDTQSWEEEHMVMELKGLSWLLVGMVTCASADFFVSKPQLMLVDITELGTIKLQLEIAWNVCVYTPKSFDSGEKMKRLSLSRLSVSARRNPLHGRTAGQSPSFTEKYFLPKITVNNDFSCPVVRIATVLSMARRLQEVEGISAAVESASRHDTGGVSPLIYPFNIPDATFLSSNNPQNATRSSTSDVLRKNQAGEPGPRTHNTDQDADVTRDSSEFEPHSFPALPTVTIQPAAASPSPPAAPPETSVGQHRARSLRIGAQISELSNLLPSQPCSEQELRALRHNLLHLATILKNDLSLLRPSSPQETLGLEEVLGSFDFLSHDINADEDASCLGTLRKPGYSKLSPHRSERSSHTLLSSVADKGSEELGPGRHANCCTVIFPQRMRATRFSPSRQELLQELSLQAEALQRVSHLLLEKNKISSTDILPQVQRTREVLLFWEACVSGSSSSPFLCDADNFCATLRKCFTHKVEAKQPGQAEKVFSRLLGQLQAPCRTVPDLRPVCCPDRVTLFQLSAYLRRWGVQDLGAHITRLSKEGRLTVQTSRPGERTSQL
ncbi:RIPOR family member 3 [Takifugu flavidus]|uniref:RIPOR family member 3 n=1 Tax=Takifugu flavidus TaxID=433684 RepID=A0A5C6N6M4_9TELE|nr:RIPOR family member 3 [Takifugu flavidus]